MNLADKQIQDFIDAWQRDFGEALSPEVVRVEANRLLDFFLQMEEGLSLERARAKGAEGDSLREAWMKIIRKVR